MGFFDSITELTGGDLLGAGAQIVGGILGNNAKSSANAKQLAFAQQQFQYQKDYARNRLQWAVEDAQKAGLHPMVAAGLSPASFSPVSVSSSPMETDWIGEAGQSLSYAASKAMDRKQQAEAFNFTKQLNQAQLDGVELDNELKVMNILAMLSTLNGSGPSAPTVNQTEPTSPVPPRPDGLPSAPKEGGYIGNPEVQFMPTASDPNVFNMHPHGDFSAVWEDKDIAGLIPLDLWPIIKVNGIDYLSRLRGKIVNGMLYSNAHGGWVSISGPYGKSALADRLGIGHLVSRVGKGVGKVINPSNRSDFDPSEYAKRFYVNY